jgi:O-antigen/teichoic acid export membrane protein
VLLSSLPYFLVSIGLVLYQQVDTVIISWLVDEKTIGWYSVAIRLYGTLFFIPNVFVIALFPALTRAYSADPTTFRKLAQKSLNLLVLMSVPIGLGILVIADHLVILLFGPAFAKSGLILAILGMILPLSYLNTLVGYLLIAMDRQKAWAPVLLIATVITIPLDLILIPWTAKAFANGALGGAFSFACTEFGMILIGFSLLPKDTFSSENAKVAAKVLLAGGVMVAAAWTVREAFILIPVVVGAVTYIAMIFLLRAIPKEDLDFFFDLGSSVFQRLRRRSAASVELKG